MLVAANTKKVEMMWSRRHLTCRTSHNKTQTTKSLTMKVFTIVLASGRVWTNSQSLSTHQQSIKIKGLIRNCQNLTQCQITSVKKIGRWLSREPNENKKWRRSNPFKIHPWSATRTTLHKTCQEGTKFSFNRLSNQGNHPDQIRSN